MGVLSTILAFIFAYLGFALSIFGLFAWVIGLVGFIILPFIPRVTGEFKRLANLPIYLATGLVGRAAVVVSEHDDILFKQMQFDDLGVELISFDNEKKEFEDPDAALHYWMGIPFALADEVHGVLFDPRHAALGTRKRDDRERNENVVYATDEDYEEYNVTHWYKGVYQFAKDAYELVNLSNVRGLVDGGERAEHPKRAQAFYENSRQPFMSGTSNVKFIMLIAALLGPFAMMWVLASQGGEATSSVGWASGVVYITVSGAGIASYIQSAIGRLRSTDSTGEDASADGGGPDMPWKPALVGLVLVLILGAVVVGLLLTVGPYTTIFAILTVALGFASIPILTVPAKASAKASGGLASILMKLGFQGYEKPVWNWTPAKYELVEAANLETTERVQWYGLFGSTVGFTFEPTATSWGAETVDTDRLESTAEVQVADGGQSSTIPPGYRRAPTITRADGMFGAFLPKRFDPNLYYVDSAIARARFTDSANGDRSFNRLMRAKEDAFNDGMADKTFAILMGGLGILSFLSGLGVFFLL
jgi:hypothetical protein